MDSVRWGLLSTANINRRLIPAIRASKRGELVAVASRSKSQADSYAKEWEIPFKITTSLWPSVAGLVSDKTAVICGLGPVGDNLYTSQESIRRITLIQRTLLLAQFLLETKG